MLIVHKYLNAIITKINSNVKNITIKKILYNCKFYRIISPPKYFHFAVMKIYKAVYL